MADFTEEARELVLHTLRALDLNKRAAFLDSVRECATSEELIALCNSTHA